MATIIPAESEKELVLVELPDVISEALAPYCSDPSAGFIPLRGASGDEWWTQESASGPVNDRASAWMRAAGVAMVGAVYGPVLWLSKDEVSLEIERSGGCAPSREDPSNWDPTGVWTAPAPAKAPQVKIPKVRPLEPESSLRNAKLPDGYVLRPGTQGVAGLYKIQGDTFPVKDDLKKLGARYNPSEKRWYISRELLPAAAAVVAAGGLAAAAAASDARNPFAD